MRDVVIVCNTAGSLIQTFTGIEMKDGVWKIGYKSTNSSRYKSYKSTCNYHKTGIGEPKRTGKVHFTGLKVSGKNRLSSGTQQLR